MPTTFYHPIERNNVGKTDWIILSCLCSIFVEGNFESIVKYRTLIKTRIVPIDAIIHDKVSYLQAGKLKCRLRELIPVSVASRPATKSSEQTAKAAA